MNETTTSADVRSTELTRATGPGPLAGRPKGRLAAARDAIGAFFGAVLGLAPHVLHHIGLVAGAAFITGASGNALFFVVGLVLSIPMLRRLYRRFQTWRAPAIAIGVFVALFSLSAFVVGPAISGGSSLEGGDQNPPAQTPDQGHSGHHG